MATATYSNSITPNSGIGFGTKITITCILSAGVVIPSNAVVSSILQNYGGYPSTSCKLQMIESGVSASMNWSTSFQGGTVTWTGSGVSNIGVGLSSFSFNCYVQDIGSGTFGMNAAPGGTVITYSVPSATYNPSTITGLSATTVTVGQSVTATVAVQTSGATVYHWPNWFNPAGSSSGTSMGASSTSYTSPVMTTANIGVNKFNLATYRTLNDVQTLIGLPAEMAFTVTANTATIVPTITGLTRAPVNDNSVVNGWAKYVKGYSKVQLTPTGVTAGTGASIAGYGYTVGSQPLLQTTNATFTSGYIYDIGTVNCSAEVRNNYNNKASRTETITVVDYEEPKVQDLVASRAVSGGTINETGTYCRITFTRIQSTVGGSNAIDQMRVRFRPVGGSWSGYTTVTNASGTAGNASLAIAFTTPSAVFSGEQIYECELSVADKLKTVIYTTIVNAGNWTMFFKNGGKNVGLGMVGTMDNTVQLKEGWDFMQGQTSLLGLMLGAFQNNYITTGTYALTDGQSSLATGRIYLQLNS